jgi:hypothetical protein
LVIWKFSASDRDLLSADHCYVYRCVTEEVRS